MQRPMTICTLLRSRAHLDVVNFLSRVSQDYLRAYLVLLADAEPLTESSQLARVREAQLRYADYRTERDPARGMLTRLFGSDFTERLIREVLFDLPRVIDAFN